MNRIDLKNKLLKNKKEKAFVAYLTAGLTNDAMMQQIVLELEKSGVDIIELGMPFSDPVADGLTIQAASAEALKKGFTLKKYFKLISRLRKHTQIPLVIMTYFNPILQYGIKKFAASAAKNGLDGVIVPDLPPEEARDLNKALKSRGVHQIFLISPVTTPRRMKKIASQSCGFIYYVTLTGVTGVRSVLPKELQSMIRKIKKVSDTPVFAGFGISNPQQVKNIIKIADGVIVGSAIVKIVLKNMSKKQTLKEISRYVASMSKMTKI